MRNSHSSNEQQSAPTKRFRPDPILFVLLILYVISIYNWRSIYSWRELDRAVYSSDQVGIATLLLKCRDPGLFPAESGLRPIHLYPRAYLGILSGLFSLTGETKKAFFVFGTALLFCFAGGMYSLILETSRHRWIAAAVAIASLWTRASFEGDFWQVSDFDAFLPRMITLATTPWLLLACGRWLGRWRLIVIFAGLGIAANFHPLSAMLLAAIFGLALLMVAKARWRHVAIVALSAAIFCATAAPYFLATSRAMRTAIAGRAAAGERPTPEEVEEAWRAASYSRFPPPWATVRWVGLHLLLPAVGGACGLALRRRRMGDGERAAVAFLCAVLLVSVGGAMIEALCRSQLNIYKSLLPLRAFHFIYLPLWVFCGWTVQHLWESRRGQATAVLLAAALTVPASAPEYAIRWVKYGGKVPQRLSLERDADFVAVCRWVLAHTDRGDLFVVPPEWNLFPLLAQRSMVASAKEASFIIYEPATGVETYRRLQAVRAAYDSPSAQGLLEAAKRYGAKYILVRDRDVEGEIVYRSGAYRIYLAAASAAE